MITAVTKFFQSRKTKTMSKILAVLCICIAAAACGGQVSRLPSDDPTPRNTPPPPTSAPTPCSNCSGTVFVGDSIFAKLAVLDPDFVSAGYVNAGIFGQRTDEMLARFNDTILGVNVCHGYNPPAGQPASSEFPYVCASYPQQFKTVVILGGWNNFFQNNPNNSTLPDTGSMVSLARSRGMNVIVCTLYAFDPAHPAPWMQPTGSAPVTFFDVWRNPLNDGIRQLSGISVVDLGAIFSGQSGYTSDGVHPTDFGNATIFSAIKSKVLQ